MLLKKWSNITKLIESGLPVLPSLLIDRNQNIEKQVADFQKQNDTLSHVLVRFDNAFDEIVRPSSPILCAQHTEKIGFYINDGIAENYYPIITGAIAKEEHLLAVNVLVVSRNELIFEVALNSTASDLSKGKVTPDIILRKGNSFEVIEGDLSKIDAELIFYIDNHIEKYLKSCCGATNVSISFIVNQRRQIFCTNLYSSNCWE